LDQDILLKNFFGAGDDDKKRKVKKVKKATMAVTTKNVGLFNNKNNNKPWEVCLKSKTPDQRNKFCKELFGVSSIAQTKCEVSKSYLILGKLLSYMLSKKRP